MNLSVILLASQSLAGNLKYGSSYTQTVNGFQSVTSTHYLISNFLHFTISGFSMYFCAIYCASFCLQRSRISTNDLQRTIPLPLDDPAGLTIQIFYWPLTLNCGYFFFISSRILIALLNSLDFAQIMLSVSYCTLFYFASSSFSSSTTSSSSPSPSSFFFSLFHPSIPFYSN